MYEKHPEVQQPPNEDEKVWRYMDFTKFLSLLESGSLYFTRADKFDDPFEGSYPRTNVVARQGIVDEFPEEHKGIVRDMMAKWGDSNRQWLILLCIVLERFQVFWSPFTGAGVARRETVAW